MVKQVSEDKENDTLEFNEFLTMMGLQNIEDIKFSALVEAFRLNLTNFLIFFLIFKLFSVFDKDNDGYLSIGELRKIMTTMGQRMKKREVEEMVLEADLGKNGLINLKGNNFSVAKVTLQSQMSVRLFVRHQNPSTA